MTKTCSAKPGSGRFRSPSFRRRSTRLFGRLPPVPVYFGLELVRQPGVIDVDPAHVVDMVRAGRAANAAGLVISWDLMHAPIDCVRALAEAAQPRGLGAPW